MIVARRCLIDRSSDRRHVDVYDLVSIRIEDWGEVKRKGVLVIIEVWPIVHQSLLQSNFVTESLVEANSPSYQRQHVCSSSMKTDTYGHSILCAYPLSVCRPGHTVR